MFDAEGRYFAAAPSSDDNEAEAPPEAGPLNVDMCVVSRSAVELYAVDLGVGGSYVEMYEYWAGPDLELIRYEYLGWYFGL